jgi:hypothetical protein
MRKAEGSQLYEYEHKGIGTATSIARYAVPLASFTGAQS